MVGCKLVLPNGELDHACKRSFPTSLSAFAHFTGLGRRRAHGRLSQYRATDLDEDESGEVDAVNGAFMLARMEAVREVGLLDEGYWLYMEDLDWCYRFWQRGWRVVYEPSAVALHVKGGSSGAPGIAAGGRLSPRNGPLLSQILRPVPIDDRGRRGLRGDRDQASHQRVDRPRTTPSTGALVRVSAAVTAAGLAERSRARGSSTPPSAALTIS